MGGKKISASFYQQRFKTRSEWSRLVGQIVSKTGFRAEEEFFTNVVYHQNRIGSFHIKGKFQGKPASLKIQGIDPGSSEASNIISFEKQNRSSLIRAPTVYKYQDYDPKSGFGYLIWEKIDARPLRQICRADRDHLEEFLRFYQEFKSEALNDSWIVPKEKTPLESAEGYVGVLEKIYQNAGTKVLTKLGYNYQIFGKRFLSLVKKHSSLWSREFTHGHLGPDDILIDREGKYIIFSHLYWGWYPIYYDFVFYFWALSLDKRRNSVDNLRALYQLWFEAARRFWGESFIPEAFELTVLDRLLGSILVQIGATTSNPTPLLRATISFFDELTQ